MCPTKALITKHLHATGTPCHLPLVVVARPDLALNRQQQHPAPLTPPKRFFAKPKERKKHKSMKAPPLQLAYYRVLPAAM